MLLNNKELCDFCNHNEGTTWIGPCGEDRLSFKVCKKCADRNREAIMEENRRRRLISNEQD